MTSGSLLELVAQRLDGVSDPVVAVIARKPDEPLARRLAEMLGEEFPSARLTIHCLESQLDLHLTMAAEGPFDLVLDAARGKGVLRRFTSLFFHTLPGGSFITRLPKDEGAAAAAGRDLVALVNDLIAARSAGVTPPRKERDQRTAKQRDFDALASSFAELCLTGRHVVAVNGVSTLAKIADQDMNRFLELCGAGGRILHTIAARTWESRCVVRSSSPDRVAELPTSYDAPALTMRQYPDVVCLPRQIIFRDNVVLPETFSGNPRGRLRNSALVEWAPNFVLEPDVDKAGPPSVLPGSWYYLDNQLRGHFGHALSEQISHLWGWRRAKESDPTLRALVFGHQRFPEMGSWEYELLAAGGIAPADILVAQGPVQVESLITTSPMLSRPAFVHPAIEDTYRQIGGALAAGAPDRPRPDRVFFSRRLGKRWCHNTTEVEALHVGSGFEVIYPEDHSLPEQVAFVRSARVIAGFAGSGMFHIALAGEPKHVIVIGSESYPAHNEYLMSSVLGHRLDLVLCRPDVPRTGRFSRASFHSDFTFDHEREGVFLRGVLADLEAFGPR